MLEKIARRWARSSPKTRALLRLSFDGHRWLNSIWPPRLRSIRSSSSRLLSARGLMYAAALGASTLLTLPVSAADATGNTESNTSTQASGDLQLQEVVVTAEKRQ